MWDVIRKEAQTVLFYYNSHFHLAALAILFLLRLAMSTVCTQLGGRKNSDRMVVCSVLTLVNPPQILVWQSFCKDVVRHP